MLSAICVLKVEGLGSAVVVECCGVSGTEWLARGHLGVFWTGSGDIVMCPQREKR